MGLARGVTVMTSVGGRGFITVGGKGVTVMTSVGVKELL